MSGFIDSNNIFKNESDLLFNLDHMFKSGAQ